MAKTVTVNDVLDGQVALDLQCLDRIYLNAYVPNLQVGGQVVSFLPTLSCGRTSPSATRSPSFRPKIAACSTPPRTRCGLRGESA
ncbi:hypothetical protein [Pseudonocardia nigra]|uniref:hypothetical protein n=1 Tax=Pseudonocardia nigra TaxID=1921578 RepID=UPI001C5FCBE9|nr:hypothetical protein [Pseudonocardia nigra]